MLKTVTLEFIPPDIQHMRRYEGKRCIEVANLRWTPGTTPQTMAKSVELFRTKGQENFTRLA